MLADRTERGLSFTGALLGPLRKFSNLLPEVAQHSTTSTGERLNVFALITPLALK
jgi:hypothetical protein